MAQGDTKGQVLWQPECVVCGPFQEQAQSLEQRSLAVVWAATRREQNRKHAQGGKLNILETCANILREINDIPKVLLTE